jgi:hypothetical protein
LHKVVISENNVQKRNEIRRKSVIADYFLSGVNAIAAIGELVSCDASSSRVGAWPFAAKNFVPSRMCRVLAIPSFGFLDRPGSASMNVAS